jgi:hypothetical protein
MIVWYSRIVDDMEWTEFVYVVAQIGRICNVLEIGIGHIDGVKRGSERGSPGICMWREFMRRVILSWVGVIQLVCVIAH